MLKINNIRLGAGEDEGLLRSKAAKILNIPENRLKSLEILKKSIDARDKNDVHFVYSCLARVDGEARTYRDKRVTPYAPETYAPPRFRQYKGPRPVVVGAGPAGLFCALTLCRAGVPPILLERGQPVERRVEDVAAFWQRGELDISSNVQFGEGGAGAFSDGKLNTGISDKRLRFILEELYKAGAPKEILYDSAPHVGTDRLRVAVKNLRLTLLEAGCDIRFGHQLVDITTENHCLRALTVRFDGGEYLLETPVLILAPGHSARDTLEVLHSRGLAMEGKPFSVGVRVEHRQADMDAWQYGDAAARFDLPAASYKLSCHLDSGRAVYSFCVCPGGTVVASASEAEGVVTNGMSQLARDGENINGAILVSVGPEDFGPGALDGIEFQRKLERAAFALGGGGYMAPAQTLGDFLAGRPSGSMGKLQPTYRPGVTPADLSLCLPPFVTEALREAIPIFGSRLKGYDDPEAVLTAVETRSSSPVRIPRDENLCSNIRGLYPCGEGAGWAGGIMSSAADGVRCAEAVLEIL